MRDTGQSDLEFRFSRTADDFVGRSGGCEVEIDRRLAEAPDRAPRRRRSGSPHRSPLASSARASGPCLKEVRSLSFPSARPEERSFDAPRDLQAVFAYPSRRRPRTFRRKIRHVHAPVDAALGQGKRDSLSPISRSAFHSHRRSCHASTGDGQPRAATRKARRKNILKRRRWDPASERRRGGPCAVAWVRGAGRFTTGDRVCGGFNMRLGQFDPRRNTNCRSRSWSTTIPVSILIPWRRRPQGCRASARASISPNPDFVVFKGPRSERAQKRDPCKRRPRRLQAVRPTRRSSCSSARRARTGDSHAVVAADEMPNMPHLDLSLVGRFALAKVKEALLAANWAPLVRPTA